MTEIQITSGQEKQRFDKFLKKYFKAASGGFLYKMLRKKNITLNKKKGGRIRDLTGRRYAPGVFFR